MGRGGGNSWRFTVCRLHCYFNMFSNHLMYFICCDATKELCCFDSKLDMYIFQFQSDFGRC